MNDIPVPSPLALRARQAAHVLGVSPRTLWAWTKRGLIPHVCIGTGRRRIVLYSVDSLKSWLSRETNQSKGAIND
jgi:excisionase family DNA binding protein